MNGPTQTPSAWARIQLVQGASNAGLWDLSSQQPEARVAVGSAPSSSWVVEGIAPHHFDFYWDGQALWVSPAGGDLRVDGERVSAWRQLVGRCRLEFSGAAMLVETSAAIAASGAEHGIAARSEDAPLIEDSQLLQLDDSAAKPLEAAPTQMVSPSSIGMPKASEPRSVGMPQRSPSSNVNSAGVFSTAAAPPPGPPMAGPPSAGPPMAGPPSAGPPMAPPPAAPAPSVPPPDNNPFAVTPATQIFDPAAAGIEMPRSDPPPPLIPSAPPPPQHAAPMPSETDVLSTSRFAPPPPPAEPQPKKGLELPPKRTLILAGIAFVASIGLLGLSFVRKNQRRAVAAQQRAQALELDRERAQTAAEEYSAAVSARLAEAEANETRLRERVGAELDALSSAIETATRERLQESLDDGEIDEAEFSNQVRLAVRREQSARAAVHLERNNFREALGAYLHLQVTYPEVGEFGRIAGILRARLRCEGSECP
ncbi:MAG: FHA domain-containing protein [Myxococcota bacterium]